MPKGVYPRRARTKGPLDARKIKDHKLWDSFKITIEDYEGLWAAYNGKCAICDEAETDTFKGKIKYLAVDHDHTNGVIRGLLCSRCNKGLGLFTDDLQKLRNAVFYLEAYKEALKEHAADSKV